MKKRLIALMLSGMVLTTALTGCSESEEKPLLSGNVKTNLYCKDVHVSVEQKDGYILHKGDVTYLKYGSGDYATSLSLTEMEFDCGKKLTTTATHSLFKEMPEEEDYDKICEQCFVSD